MVFGFLTFGTNVDGLFILDTYCANDDLASFCRFPIAISLAVTYPLSLIGSRDAILHRLMVPHSRKTDVVKIECAFYNSDLFF